MPSTQLGVVSGGGTDYPHHLLLSALDYAAMLSISIFILLVGLIKAFDRVLRELVFGFPQSVGNPCAEKHEHLLSVAFSPTEADWILDYLDREGCAFDQRGVDPKLKALACGLHTGAWAACGECTSYIVSTTGSRQGCKLGALVLNVAFSFALKILHQRLLESGIVLKLRFNTSRRFWCSGNEHVGGSHGSCKNDDDEHNVLDASFVDDQPIILIANGPWVLRARLS